MPNQHTDRVARVARRKDVAKLYLKGWTQAAIAEKLGVAQGTISSDLRMVQKEWRQSAVRAVQARHVIEMAKLDALERELWEAWETSRQPTRGVGIVKEVATGKEMHRSNQKEQNGDPRFLAIVQKCLIMRGAIAQPRGSQESPDDVETELRVRRDRVLAFIDTLRERKRMAEVREQSDSNQPGNVRALVESEVLPPAPPPPA